jgi:hypothetical protein
VRRGGRNRNKARCLYGTCNLLRRVSIYHRLEIKKKLSARQVGVLLDFIILSKDTGLTASSAWTCTQPNPGSYPRCTSLCSRKPSSSLASKLTILGIPAIFSCGIQRQVLSSNHGRFVNCPYAPVNSLRAAPNLFAHPVRVIEKLSSDTDSR